MMARSEMELAAVCNTSWAGWGPDNAIREWNTGLSINVDAGQYLI
jgi:hypothetical protein